MLCVVCKGIFYGDRLPLWEKAPEITRADGFRDVVKEQEFEQKRLRYLHKDVAVISRGAIEGCTICDIVWRHFFRDKTAEEYQRNPNFFRKGQVHTYFGSGTHYKIMKPGTFKRTNYGRDALEIQIGLNSPMDRDIPEYKDIMLEPLNDEPAVNIKSLPLPDVTVYGSHTFRQVQKWIAHCKKYHRRCNKTSAQGQWYPSRLLDLDYIAPSGRHEQIAAAVELFGSGHLPAHCKLIETFKSPVHGSYMTLSHRWNPLSKKCVTERSNIEQRKVLIRASELPKIFEQAVQFTRSLGVRYLWIDSLCIVQDDDDDWKREASAMGKVYAHSMLNLEATIGERFLHQPRNPRPLAPCLVQSNWSGFTPVTYVVIDFRYWDSRIQRSVCNTRAWITQERWLAPRVLHFTFDQLLWECCELEAGETYPHGLAKEITSQSSIGFKACSPLQDHMRRPITEHQARAIDWYRVLITYARAEVTFKKDRLIAISGVAAAFSKVLNDQCVAGMWRKMLPGELLWQVVEARRSNKKPKPVPQIAHDALQIERSYRVYPSKRLRGRKWQAPSWSWASVLGDIMPGPYMRDGSEDTMIDILEVNLTPHDPEIPLGQLISGSLTVKGLLYPIAMDPPDWTPEAARKDYLHRPTLYLTGLGMKPLSDSPFSGLSQSVRDLAVMTGLPEPLLHSHTISIMPDEPLDFAVVARSFFLPIRKHVISAAHDSQHNGATLVSGIGLLPNGKQGEYTRIGKINFSNTDTALFIEDNKIQKGLKTGASVTAHPPTQNKSLYTADQIGVVTIL